MKDYVSEIIDLTSDGYLNPIPAVYDNGTHLRSIGTITSISIHHDAAERPHDYDSVARYKNEAALHYRALGPGLQYHFKIDNVGQIFRIRPLSTWLYVVGSTENVTNLAICLDGYFQAPYNQTPTREQYEALGQLLVNLCEQHPEFPATYPDVRPHRDFSVTSCPGDLFAPWVYAIQSKADVENIPADAVYDWPSYQPQAPTVNVPISPDPVAPVPPVVIPAPPVTPVPTTPSPPDPVATPPNVPTPSPEVPGVQEPAPTTNATNNTNESQGAIMNPAYNKLYVAVAGALVQLLTSLLGVTNVYTVTAIGLFTALGVYQASNSK